MTLQLPWQPVRARWKPSKCPSVWLGTGKLAASKPACFGSSAAGRSSSRRRLEVQNSVPSGSGDQIRRSPRVFGAASPALGVAAAAASALALLTVWLQGHPRSIPTPLRNAPSATIAASWHAEAVQRAEVRQAARVTQPFASTSIASSVSSATATTYFQRQRANEVLVLKLTLLVQQVLAAHVAVKVIAKLHCRRNAAQGTVRNTLLFGIA